jgi:hypothetical protein
MAQQIQAYAVSAPGFFGLNTQDSSLDLASGYALVANNAVIDQYGRIGARKGYTLNHSTAIDSADVKTVAELITIDGTSWTLCAGNNKLYKLVGSTLTELTFNGVGTAPTITDSNWSTAYLNGDIYFYQSGHVPLGFSPSSSTTTYYRVDQEAGYNGTVQQANIVISALGRIWNANTSTDKVTVQWSDIKNPQKFGSGTAGTLDTTSVWPKGGDTITALAVHNGFLFIFGYRNILIYSGATTPATMTLHDTISGIGCIARDSVQVTETDIIFLSETGVRSVMRTIQEKSAPLNDLSKNVRNDLTTAAALETKANIKSVYNPREAFYAITFPTTNVTYVFDRKAQLQDGSSRVTTWDLVPKSFCQKADGTMLIGLNAYVGTYTGNYDNSSTYRFSYYTNYTDLGTPVVTSLLKNLLVTVVGGNNQVLTMKWDYDFKSNYSSQQATIPTNSVAYYGESEYNYGAEYSSGIVLQVLKAYGSGSGKAIQVGFEVDINGSPLSIQKIEMHAKNGKITNYG